MGCGRQLGSIEKVQMRAVRIFMGVRGSIPGFSAVWHECI